ncbi:MAG: aminoacyl--tRNA ligase-related protein [Candidatus Paceibacterota bacterium]|jgi:prolyl-tRNA synthetase
MRQSKLFTKTKKEFPRDEEAKNAKLLIRAGFIDKLMAGVYSFLPLGLRVIQKIENIIREEMNNADGQEVLMPVLHPKENWEKTGRWGSFDALYKLKSRFDKEFALGPTHEEIIVPLAKQFINSYKNLPSYLYQIQTKLRDEERPKSGLLRGREFLMKDFYSFHESEKDLDTFYNKMIEVYQKTFKKLGLDTLVVEASGGSFSKYSHEFQALNENGEDKIIHCDCGFAQNKEICSLKEGDKCPKCSGKVKVDNGIEVGNIFRLGTKFSEAFDLKFKGKDGKEKMVEMGCYGMGISRIMAAIAEVSSDDKGLVWPENVSPFKIHLMALGSQKKEAEKIYQSLQKENIAVLFDDRDDISVGEKFADADLIGIPYRIVISDKTVKEKKVELKKRKEEKARLVTQRQLLKLI